MNIKKLVPQVIVLPISKVAVSPASAICKVGNPLGPAYRYADMCIMYKGITGTRQFINSTILKSALLNEKEFFEKELGLKITDINAEPDPAYTEPEYVEPPQEPEPEKVDPTDGGALMAPNPVEEDSAEQVKVDVEESTTELTEEEKKELVDQYMPEAKQENISEAPQSIEDLPYAEIRAHAKNMGLDFKGNPKKEVLIKMIKGE